MASRNDESVFDDLLEIFKVIPSWIGPTGAAIVFVLLRFGVPLLIGKPPAGMVDPAVVWRPLLILFSWVAPLVILMAWTFAEIWKRSNRKLLDRQTGIDSVRNLSWGEFERLVCEAYRRQGYAAAVVGSRAGDGGIDVILIRAGEKVLVQCKHWKAFKVGVAPVRELLGVVVSEKATSGILVTSGRFTKEAERFARANPQLKLVAAAELVQMIGGVRSAPATLLQPTTPAFPITEPPCPTCGARMVLRTARKGQNAGSQFWGCSSYPRCAGKRAHV